MISIIIPSYPTSKSLDLTTECLKGLWDKGQVILINDMQPFAKNVNAGLKIARGDIIIIANNDLRFMQDDWLEHLINPLKDYDICSIRTTEQGWDVEDRLEEDAKFGSIWAMNRKVYDTIGGLDESFGNYAEDLDYRRRALNAGFKIVKNHAGIVEHLGKATTREIDPEDKMYHEAIKRYIEKWGFIE